MAGRHHRRADSGAEHGFFPVLSVRKRTEPVAKQITDGFAELRFNNGFSFWGKIKPSVDETGTAFQWMKHYQNGARPDTLPENNPLSV